MNRRNLAALAGAAALLGAFAAPAQADDPATAVCNEAEASWQGGYTVTGSQDPNPPARLYGGPGEAMAVGPATVNPGLLNAAERSPALAVCAAGDGDTSGDGDDTGGDDTGGDWGGAS